VAIPSGSTGERRHSPPASFRGGGGRVVYFAPVRFPGVFRDTDERFWALLLAMLAVQLSAVVLIVRSVGVDVPLVYALPGMVRAIVVPLGASLLLRIVVRSVRGGGVRAAARDVLERWWEFPVIILAYVLLVEAYTWGKVFVPLINPRTWDTALAGIDRFLCLGVDPNVAFLTVFEGAPRLAAAFIDRFYGLFGPVMLAVTAWFSTDRPARRKGFFLAVSIVWSAGLWMYVAIPARGPVYVQPLLWQEVMRVFPETAGIQLALYRNYEAVLALLHGANVQISPALGVAAMPSLHVGAHALFLFWCLGLGSRWRTVFLVTTVLTFLGAVAMGWHWAVDGWVGLALGAAAARIGLAVAARIGKGEGADLRAG